MCFGCILIVILNIYDVHTKKTVLTFDCEHIFTSPAIFPANKLPTGSFTFRHSYNSSIVINSTCCEELRPNNTKCGPCSDSGEMTCFVQQDKVIDLQADLDRRCLNETTYHFTCHERLCNGTIPPLYTTACDNETNLRQVCQRDGSWILESCLESTTVGQKGITTEFQEFTEAKALTTERPTHIQNTSQVVNVELTTVLDGRSGKLILETTWPMDNDTSTVPILEKEQIRHDWMNFLIALGVILVVVIFIVCGFFIRKRKKEKDVDDYSLEYWHETEYIDSICGKASCTINPMQNESGKDIPSQRYIRKDDLCNTTPSYINQGFGKGGSDVPRSMKHDYTDKFVTTATGSNFYSYRTSPDVDLADSGSNLSPPRIPRAKLDVDVDKTSSFKPKYNKKQQKGRKRQLEAKPPKNGVDNDEIYAVSYKNKLKRELGDWSAEESDV